MASVSFQATAIFTKNVFVAGSNNPRYNPSYSIGVVVKEGTSDFVNIKAAIDQCIAVEYPEGYPDHLRAQLKFRKAEEALQSTKEFDNSRYHGKGLWVLNLSSSEERPFEVAVKEGNMLKPLMDKTMIFPGCIVGINLNIRRQDQAKDGIGYYCNGILASGLVGEFGRLDGRPTIEQQFGSFEFSGTATTGTVTSPAPVPPPAAAKEVMIEGQPLSAWIAAGWTEETLKAHGKL